MQAEAGVTNGWGGPSPSVFSILIALRRGKLEALKPTVRMVLRGLRLKISCLSGAKSATV